MASDFTRDNEWQRSVRDRVLAPGFYGRHAFAGRYVFIDKGELALRLQREFAVDTIMQSRDGRAVCIEEKIVRWPGYAYTAFTLETESCTVPGRESKGWMHYGQADFLLYAMHRPDDSLLVHLVDFQKLKAWFWPRVETFSVFAMRDTLNKSAGRKVPISDIEASMRVWKLDVRVPVLQAAE